MDVGVVLVLLLLAAVVAAFCLPPYRRPPRWRLAAARQLERIAGRLRRREAPPDPFAVLRVQMRLSILADEVRALEDDLSVYAKAHRLRATKAAYDDLLDEACRLAGVPLDPAGRRGEHERLRAEVELTSRGWSW